MTIEAIHPAFLDSPKSLFNLLFSSRRLRALSGVEPVYLTFVLNFAGLGDTQAFSYSIPSSLTGFLWYMGYRVTAGLEGNLAGQVAVDGQVLFLDPAHLRPEFGADFTHFQPANGTIVGAWVAGAAGRIQYHFLGMLVRADFFQRWIEPVFDKAGLDMGM